MMTFRRMQPCRKFGDLVLRRKHAKRVYCEVSSPHFLLYSQSAHFFKTIDCSDTGFRSFKVAGPAKVLAFVEA